MEGISSAPWKIPWEIKSISLPTPAWNIINAELTGLTAEKSITLSADVQAS